MKIKITFVDSSVKVVDIPTSSLYNLLIDLQRSGCISCDNTYYFYHAIRSVEEYIEDENYG